MSSTTTDPSPRLRRARELAGMTERHAARELGVRRRELRSWESGTTVPDADELARAVRLYSSDLDQLWPDRQPLLRPDEPGVLVVGEERIELTASADGRGPDNRVVLARYLAAVRRQRGLGDRDAVELRADDIAALATVLDLDDEELGSELADLLDLTPAGAGLITRALVVGGLMALGATGVVGASWLTGAPPASALDERAPAAAHVTFAPEVSAPAPTASGAPAGTVLFAPAGDDPTAPVDAEVVEDGSSSASPFSTEPNAAPVELAPAVFATAPATEWTPVPTAEGPATPELPAG